MTMVWGEMRNTEFGVFIVKRMIDSILFPNFINEMQDV
jgi:hypothetical protein